MQLLDKQTRLATALIDATTEQQAATLAAIREAASHAASAKGVGSEANKEANEAGGSLWSNVLGLTRFVNENAGELDVAGQDLVVRSLIADALAGEAEAIKTTKSYTATACKALKAVVVGTVKGWGALETRLVVGKDGKADSEEAIPYKDVRNLIKAAGQLKVEETFREAVKMLRDIAGRENSTRAAETRQADLVKAMASFRSIRDNAVQEADAAKPASKAAKAADDLKQQQPSAPMATEVTKQAESKAA